MSIPNTRRIQNINKVYLGAIPEIWNGYLMKKAA